MVQKFWTTCFHLTEIMYLRSKNSLVITGNLAAIDKSEVRSQNSESRKKTCYRFYVIPSYVRSTKWNQSCVAARFKNYFTSYSSHKAKFIIHFSIFQPKHSRSIQDEYHSTSKFFSWTTPCPTPSLLTCPSDARRTSHASSVDCLGFTDYIMGNCLLTRAILEARRKIHRDRTETGHTTSYVAFEISRSAAV